MGKKKTRFQWEREPSQTEVEERPSRRSLKREDNLHREMAKVLIDLSAEQWDRLPLSESLRDALEEARRLKFMTGVREACAGRSSE